MNHRKAQIEIIGLLVIVVLISLGLLFALYFLLGDTDENNTLDIQESILASSTVSTLRKTVTSCNENTIETLLVNCARTRGSIQCGSKNSCDFANNVMDDIFTAFFNHIQRDYSATITGVSQLEGVKFGKQEGCPGEQESDEQPIPVGTGYDIFIKLDICR